MGIISPTQNNSLLDSKLVFSGSQLTTAIQKTVEQFTATKESAPSNAYEDRQFYSKQPSPPQRVPSDKKGIIQKVSVLPATGESLEIAQMYSE